MRLLSQCPSCGSKEIDPFFTWKDATSGTLWKVSTCSACTLAFTNPQPSWEELAPFYDRDYKPYQLPGPEEVSAIEGAARRTMQHDRISLDRLDRVLELGPGSGRFMLAAQAVCAEAIAVEPSAHAAETLRAQGCNVFNGHLSDFRLSYTGAPFSLVYLSHVLEHLPDPFEALNMLGTLISKESRIVIRVPNAGSWAFRAVQGHWMGTDLPRHLTHWNLAAMTDLAQRAGMRVGESRFDSPPGIVQQALTAHARHHYKIPNKVIWLLPSLVWSIAERRARRWLNADTAMNMEVELRLVS